MTFEDFRGLIIIIIIAGILLACGIIDAVHDTEHIYWTSDTKHEAIDEAIEQLVNAEIDSLIVTHPNKPNITGYVYFKPNKE